MKKQLLNIKVLRIIFFLLILQGLAVTHLFAQTSEIKEFDAKTLTNIGQEAFKDLSQTKTFTLAGFGAAAAPFRSTNNLIRLLNEKQTEVALRTIVKNANPEGQVYALIGLQVIKSKHFDAEFKFFKQTLSEKQITKIFSEDGGCDSASTTLKIEEVVKKIESKEYAQTFARRYIP